MTQFTNRADLLIAAGESIKMQENAGITPTMKTNGILEKELLRASFCLPVSQYEFPIAVVEGRPVFVGDEVYIKNRIPLCTVKIVNDQDYETPNSIGIVSAKYYAERYELSWNPTKPKTVIVELLRDDAYKFINCGIECPSYSAVFAALNKALEN